MNRSNVERIKANTPCALRELPQWVCWRVEVRDGKSTKVPVIPGTSQRASSTDPSHWSTFAEAMAAFEADDSLVGVGFVFRPDGPYCGVDIDDCRNVESGDIAPWARQIIETLSSYTEISPSGTGVKIFLQGKKPGRKCRKSYESGEVEMYDRARFFTVTGAHLEGTPPSVEERQDALDTLYASIFGNDEQECAAPVEPTDVNLSDDEIVKLITSGRKNNEKFSALWAGRWNDYYNSPSEADSSLVFKLAYFTKDAAQIDRLFRQSGLYRDKWDELRGDESYGQITISRALSKVTKQYRPKGKRASSTPAPRAHGAKGLPRIVIDDIQLDDLTAQALDALMRVNDPPVMYVRGGYPSRIIRDEKNLCVIQPFERTRMRCRLGQSAVWLSLRKKGDDIVEVDTNPPLYLAENVLALGDWPFPPLLGIAQAPILRPDGRIRTMPGYDPETMLVYAPADGLTVPEIPESPTREQIDRAREMILDVIADFPFDGEASRANALSLLFSILMRPAINGSFPMLLVDAPVQGTGKTLLVMALASIAVEAVPVQTAPAGRKDKEEEWRKRISTILLESHQVVLVDNLPENESFDSVSLAAALTSPEWIDRRLGKNESIAVPSRCVWTATGNNLRVTGDMPRRCYTVRLDANDEKPWERKGFRHGDIVEYVKAHRGELLCAAYTLIRAWYAADKPKPTNRISFGSFQEWADSIGGVLETAGIPSFLENLEVIRSVQDDEAAQWRAFFSAWWETIGWEPVMVDDVIKRIMAPESLTEESLPDCLSLAMEKSVSSLKRSLGRHLATMTGRVFEGRKLADAGKHPYRKVRMWKLIPQEIAATMADRETQVEKSERAEWRFGGLRGLNTPVCDAGAHTRIHDKQGESNLLNLPNLHTHENGDSNDGEVVI
jgi:hypothetical protein